MARVLGSGGWGGLSRDAAAADSGDGRRRHVRRGHRDRLGLRDGLVLSRLPRQVAGLGDDHQRVVGREMPRLALHVGLGPGVLEEGAHRGQVVGEHGGLEELLVCLPVGVLLAPGGRCHGLVLAVAAVEHGRHLSRRGVVPVQQVGVVVHHGPGDLADGIAGRLGADDADPARVVARRLLLHAVGRRGSRIGDRHVLMVQVPGKLLVVGQLLVVGTPPGMGALVRVGTLVGALHAPEEVPVAIDHCPPQTCSSSRSFCASSWSMSATCSWVIFSKSFSTRSSSSVESSPSFCRASSS